MDSRRCLIKMAKRKVGRPKKKARKTTKRKTKKRRKR
jgi:hypothetical protein